MDNENINDLIKFVGGEKNISSVVHCATRLRFKLIDNNLVNKNEIDSLPGVIQTLYGGGQFQVVIGTHVNEVYDRIMEKLNLNNSESRNNESKDNKEKVKLFDKFIDIVSGVFTPFLGALAGVGIIKGVLTFFTTLQIISPESGAYKILFAAGDGFMQFLPFAIAVTAAKKFKADKFVSIAITAALVYPEITEIAANGTLDFFGVPVFMLPTGYMQTIIPIIFSVWLQSWVERKIRQFIPNILKIILVPVITILVMVPVTFIIIGPMGVGLGTILGNVYGFVFNLSPLVAGLLLGGLFQVFVMFGLHWGLAPIGLNNFSLHGYDTLSPLILPSVIAQSGSSFGVMLKTKSQKRKALAASAGITAIFGITEPSVYGVTLPLKKPFIASCIGGAVGSAIMAVSGVKMFGGGLLSILTIPNFISSIPGVSSPVAMAILALVIAFVVSFLVTIIIPFDYEEKESTETTEVTEVTEQIKEVIYAPISGKMIKLQDVNDAVFSSNVLGKGIAIEPTDGKLFSPVDGTVTAVFPTGHAIGLTTDSGVEILLHIGLDTVDLKGEGFETKVTQGSKVKRGELLVEFDIEKIQSKKKEPTTIIVITNTDKFLDIIDSDKGKTLVGEQLLTVVF